MSASHRAAIRVAGAAIVGSVTACAAGTPPIVAGASSHGSSSDRGGLASSGGARSPVGTSGVGTSSGSAAASTSGVGSGDRGPGDGGASPPVSADALTLCQLVNEYREQNGLPAVPLSVALMAVASDHVGDLTAHPSIVSATCELHSWSTGSSLWTGCCYTSDNSQAMCMWEKPQQITASWGAGKAYTAYGYEDASEGTDPATVLQIWENDPAHNDVILNLGMWASRAPWPAMGCGMQGGYGVLWFGDAADTQTYAP